VDGYEGADCSTDTDECSSSPCVNGATCSDSTTALATVPVHAYSCACADGYASGNCSYSPIAAYQSSCALMLSTSGAAGTGNCEVDVDECASSPCQNGATCSHGVSSWSCLCVDGYEGADCSTDTDECSSSPCVNGATCSDSSTVNASIPVHDYSCSCVDGYASGVCNYSPIVPAYTSQCALTLSTSGATGTGNCEVDVDECSSSPCQNGGTCYQGVSSWSCQCATVASLHVVNVTNVTQGWSGEFCEITRDLCGIAEDDCDPLYATCNHLGPGQHSCTCHIGWNGNGHTCYDNDECASNPCQNSGTCSESNCSASAYPGGTACIGQLVPGTSTNIPIGSYSCACADGFADGMCTAGWDSHGTAYTALYNATCATQLGGTCSIDIDECVSSPCMNNAGCSESAGQTVSGSNISFAAYSCACAAGYANGDCAGYSFIAEYTTQCQVFEDGICDVDVNECSSSPCMNGAVCADSSLVHAGGTVPPHSYRCVCGAGYSNGLCLYNFITEYATQCNVILGGNCDVDVNECMSAPCVNGATCSESSTDSTVSTHAYQCTCAAGFANGECEYDFITEYTAQCTVTESDDGVYSGNCDVDVDECSSSPCVNGAT
jgi:hypothetical protein